MKEKDGRRENENDRQTEKADPKQEQFRKRSNLDGE